MGDERRSRRRGEDSPSRERSSYHRSRRSGSRSRSRSPSRERDRRSKDYDPDRGRHDHRRSSREYDDRSRRDRQRDDYDKESSRRRSHDEFSRRRHLDSPDRASPSRNNKRSRHADHRREDGTRDDSRDYEDKRRHKHGPHATSTKADEDSSLAEDDIDESIIIRMETGNEEDEAQKVLEESRKRREAIRQKYKHSESNGPGQGNGHVVADMSKASGQPQVPMVSAVSEGLSHSLRTFRGEAGIAPAAPRALPAASVTAFGRASSPETPQKDEDANDMFTDDMFGQSPGGGRQLGQAAGVVKDSTGLTDNWDDAEGYYTSRAGETLDGRYEVIAAHGRGVFSSVVKATDLKAPSHGPKEVAIKIIRNNETMFKAGQQELVILKKLAGADPEDKRHCVRLLSSFSFRGHLCLVFESLEMNLREVLKKYGRNIGIKLSAVRAYATQLFLALKHLRNCGVLHCDIKPDNMLVNEAKNILKLADFGSAMFTGDNEITPYLVSRFYRAPEIMLGLTYDHALDMWSVGCCLYELYTGKMLFPGRNNNDMLRLHIELKGPFPKKLLKKAAFVDQHFDSDFNFCALEEDPVNPGKTVKRILTNVKPKDMAALLATSGSTTDNPHALASFRDLLDKIFALDPDKRITASQALNHPFIVGK